MQKQFFILALLLPISLFAQRKVEHHNLVWVGYYNTTAINERYSLMTDVQLRTKDWVNKWAQQLVRSGVTYRVNKKWSATAGFAFFRTAQYVGGEPLFKKEWRPWQELSYKLEGTHINFTQRLRTEQRFQQQVSEGKLTSRYQYIFRLRYKADVQVPVIANKLSLGIGNEILVNPTKSGTPDLLDQNRASGSLFWKVTPRTTLQWQYINIIQKKYRADVIDNQDVVRFNVHHQLKWKQK